MDLLKPLKMASTGGSDAIEVALRVAKIRQACTKISMRRTAREASALKHDCSCGPCWPRSSFVAQFCLLMNYPARRAMTR